MTGTQRRFAHLPRVKDEPEMMRAILAAVGANWQYVGTSGRFRTGEVLEVHNAKGGSIGVAVVTGIEGSSADGFEVTVRFDPWHDFSKDEPKIATEPEPEWEPCDPLPPARASRKRVRRARLG